MRKTLFTKKILALVVQHFLPQVHTLFYPPHPLVDYHDLHEMQIKKFVANTYVKLRINNFLKPKTAEILRDKANVRFKVHKTILLYHIHII